MPKDIMGILLGYVGQCPQQQYTELTFLSFPFRLQRKRPYSPPLITSTPIQNDVTDTPVEGGTTVNVVEKEF